MLRRYKDAKVLVIDDNRANIELLVALLGRAGLHNVVSAADGRTGLRLASEMQADAILLDLHMPTMDGVTVLEELAALSIYTAYLPVLVLTADMSPSAMHRALALGAKDFVTKPFDATELMLRVRNLLETRFLYAALRDHNIALADELERRTMQEQLLEYTRREQLGRIERVLDGDTVLSIVFQPIVDLSDRAVVGLEALSRFAADPSRSPDRWFDEAASVGLGLKLELKAVIAAISQVDRLPPGAFLAVNVSPEFVMSKQLDDLADSALCPRLVLELTEHVAVDDYDPIRRCLDPLRERGARVAVDDTGAGFSSMRHILLLEPEIIKLDRSLTHGVDHDPARRALASSLVSFAKDIGSTIIAEGVETAEELSTLERLGAHWVQGFHIARPNPLPTSSFLFPAAGAAS